MATALIVVVVHAVVVVNAVVVDDDDGNGDQVEHEDVQRCLAERGDCGWVQE